MPFVPVENVTLDECEEMARTVGRRLGEALAIPVYLYEAAASSPPRTSLADERRRCRSCRECKEWHGASGCDSVRWVRVRTRLQWINPLLSSPFLGEGPD